MRSGLNVGKDLTSGVQYRLLCWHLLSNALLSLEFLILNCAMLVLSDHYLLAGHSELLVAVCNAGAEF